MRLDFIEDTGTWAFSPVFHRFFNPVHEISREAAQLHGLTKDRLVAKGARGFTREDAIEITAHLNGCKGIIGHNLGFDLQSLNDQFLAIGAVRLTSKLYSTPAICTQKLAREKLDVLPMQSSLNSVFQRLFNERFDGAHVALADAIATARIWTKLRLMN